MLRLPESARAIFETKRLGHLVTRQLDGSPQVTCIWVGLDGNDIVSGHLGSNQQKLRNVRRDDRVILSIETDNVRPPGLAEYIVIHGTARIEDGGAAALLQDLAHRYLGPDVKFPPMDNPPPGHILRITPLRIGGIGPWVDSP